MDNNTQTIDSSGAGALPPNDDFTPAERAYFQSRGSDIFGLETPPGSSPASSPSAGTPQTETPGASQAADAVAPPDDVNVDDITIGQDGKPRDKSGRWVKSVPHSVFHAANEKRKAAEAAVQSERERFIRAEERLNVLNESIAPKEAKTQDDPNAPIDPEKDIFGAFRQAIKQINDLKAKLTETDNKHTTAFTEAQLHQQFTQDAQKFVASNPDFGDAFTHLVTTRHRELEFAGMMDQAQRDAQISKEAREMVRAAQKQGLSPAERIYALAKLRGYQPKQQQQAVDPTTGQAAQDIARTNAGQAASLSLKNAGGAPQSDALSLSRIADMGDAEFQATRATYIAKHGKPSWDKFIRGE